MKTVSKTFISEALKSIDENIDVITEEVSQQDIEQYKEEIYRLVDEMLTLAMEAEHLGLDSMKFVLQDAMDEINNRISLVDYKTEESLIEAISPEDEAENEILRRIWHKTKARANSALTPEEKAIMKKYNLDRVGGYDSQTRIYTNDNNIYNHDIVRDPYREYKINYVDRARKNPQRGEYRKYINNARYSDWASPDEQDKAYEDKTRYTNDRKAQSALMTADYRNMRSALKASKYARKELANLDADYDQQRKQLLADYQSKLRKLYDNEGRRGGMYQQNIKDAEQQLSDIKQKHKM